MLDKYMNRRQIAAYLGVHEVTINKWLKKGLPFIQIGSGRKLYDPEQCKKWLLGEK